MYKLRISCPWVSSILALYVDMGFLGVIVILVRISGMKLLIKGSAGHCWTIYVLATPAQIQLDVTVEFMI